MVNILPNQAKKRLLREYYTRVLTVWLYLFSAVFLLLIMLFLPSLVLFNNYFENYNRQVQLAVEEVADFDELVKTLKSSFVRSKAVIDYSKTNTITYYLQLFFGLAEDSDVKIKTIMVVRSGSGEVERVGLSGLSSNRQQLTQFRELILQQAEVAEVDFPISSLVKSKDISFSLDVKFKTSEHVE